MWGLYLTATMPHTVKTEEKELLRALDDLNARVVRLETMVDRDLGKEGTLEKLEDKVDGINTRALFTSGGITAALNALRYLPALFK